MADKYEEFKEWFKKSKYVFWRAVRNYDFGVPPSMVFDAFEKEQSEKDKEKKVKNILARERFHYTYDCLTEEQKDKIDYIYRNYWERI